jgi:hypothetical protein
MKTRILFLTAVFPVLLCLSILFSSCAKDENPVNPVDPPPVAPDTVSRYIWSTNYYSIPLYDLYVADTNLIYMIGGNNHPIVYNGFYINPYNLNDINFYSYRVYGYDKNNVFWAGQTIKNNQNYPAIIKVTNGIPQSYVIESETGWLDDILIIGPNQAWFVSYFSNYVYYFDNGTIKAYKLSETDSTQGGRLYKNTSNEVFVFVPKADPPYYKAGHLFTYKFANDSFQFIRRDSLNNFSRSPDCLSGIIFKCGADAIMINFNDVIHYFNGNEWLVHTYSGSVSPLKVGGVSKDSLVTINCFESGTPIYTYGASKRWRRENNSPFFPYVDIGSPSNVEFKFGNVYFNHWDDIFFNKGNYIGSTYFLIGRPNKNFKN